MALYRNVQMTFWTDSKVVDDFTPEDRYFYLYLITNPHTNLAGCYEVSTRQMANETGYSKETIERLIARFISVHGVIKYSSDTKEVLLLNWHRYSWTKSEKFRVALIKDINTVKDSAFKEYLMQLYDGADTVSIPYSYGMDTTVTVTDTDTVSDTDADSDKENKNTKNIKNPKKEYGEYKKVKLTDDEFKKLVNDFGSAKTEEAINFLDGYIVDKNYKSKEHYIAIRRWVIDAVNEQAVRRAKDKQGNTKAVGNESAYQRDREWAEEMQAMQEKGELNGF